jgi:L-alanine-DL-glutamate epimerase-like enolase superfamily enzyme
LQLAAATPNCVVFEFCQAYHPLLYDLLTTPVAVDADGNVTVPTEPGLGVELQPEHELVRSRARRGTRPHARQIRAAVQL